MTASRRARVQAWALAIAWMAMIFVLSSQPSLPDLGPNLTELQDIAGHFVAYAGLAFWLARALRRTPGVRHPLAWAVVLAMLYALSDELHQAFVPNRHADPFDILVDFLGVITFVILDFGFGIREGRRRG